MSNKDTPTLFPENEKHNDDDVYRAPSSGTDTSDDAAAKISPSATALRLRVYSKLIELGDEGATREELEQLTGLDGNTLRPRIWELMGNGDPRRPRLVADSGRRRTGRSGRSAIVLVALRDKANR